jgi:hypothetical protein
MYLFSRVATLRGSERNSLAWAAEVSGYVNDHSDHAVSLWRADFGRPVGTVIWSAWVESHDDLAKGFANLATDDGYHSLIEKGQEFVTDAPSDFLRQAIHGEPGPTAPPIGAVTTVTTAVVGNGRYAEAMAWGVEMAQLVEQVSGAPTLFLVDSYGTFGQVTWLTGAADMAAADAAGEAINANADYMKRLSDVGDLFVPASGDRALVSRIA